MIDTIAKCDLDQTKTYKVCVDGNKINPSSKGDIRLWGHEESPTYNDRQNRLET